MLTDANLTEEDMNPARTEGADLDPPECPGTVEVNEHRGALRGTPGSAYPQPEPNATELPSNAPGRPELV